MRTLLSALALLLVAGPASAQMRGMTAKPYTPADESGGPDDATQAIDLAFQLATYGQDNDDADALLTAAGILIETDYEAVDRQPTIADDAPPATGTAETTPAFEPAALIAEARRLDPSVGARADALNQAAAARGGARGASNGPSTSVWTVAPYTTHTYNIRFNGGQYAAIAVSGDGDTDIDCTVYNGGYSLGGDYSYEDTCYLQWYVPYTTTYTIQLNNLGGMYNSYVISTN